MKSKKILFISVFTGIFLGFFQAPAAGQGYAIEYRVFRGSSVTKKAPAGPVVVTASFADPVFVQAYDPAVERKADADRAAVLKADLAAIYKIAEIEMVRANRIIWDGKKESVSEVILIGGDYFPISLSPRKLEGRRISMAVEIRRYRDLGPEAAASSRERLDEIAPSGAPVTGGLEKWDTVWGSGERIADSEMTARLDETIVLGFPLGDASFFVSFRVQEPPEDRYWREVVERIQRTERAWPSGIAVPPKPRFRLIPAFPEGARNQGIEGLVVLKVTVDPEGRPTDFHVAKGAAISLNLAALAAMKQWRFEPVFERGKAVGTSFFISFDFRLNEGRPGPDVPSKRRPEI